MYGALTASYLLQIFETAYIMHLRRRRFFGGSSEKLPFISQRRHSLTREKVTQALYTTKAAFSRRAEGEAQHTSVTNSATLGVLQTRDPYACDAAALQQLLCALQYTRSTSLGILDQVFATAKRNSTRHADLLPDHFLPATSCPGANATACERLRGSAEV